MEFFQKQPFFKIASILLSLEKYAFLKIQID